MRKGCCVPGCGNKSNTKGIHFFRFPKKEKSSSLWNQWSKKIFFNTQVNQDLDLFVCSSHFQENDYKRDLKSELLNLPPKKILNENALPSLNLPDGSASQLPIQPPKLVPLTVQGNTNIPPVGLLIYQYNVPGNAQVGNNNITANPNSQVIVENTTENALKAKLVQLKADLKGEKVKYTLLKRKMRELKDKAAELHTSSAETLRAISDGKTNESFNGSNLIEPISKFTIKKKKYV